MPPVRPHGSYDVSIDGRVLRAVVCGPWNVELVQAYADAFAQQVHTLAGAPWGTLAILTGEALHTAESHQAVVETVRQHRTLGRCATAVVMRVNSVPAMIRALFTRLYAEAGEPCEFFDDETQALQWLQAQIKLSESGAAPLPPQS
jgi:hypothetical protein